MGGYGGGGVLSITREGAQKPDKPKQGIQTQRGEWSWDTRGCSKNTVAETPCASPSSPL